MPKISFLGAGSTIFAKNLMGDILGYPEFKGDDVTFSLHDINADRLHTSKVVAHKLADYMDASPKIEATLDRRESLDGADYAICMVQVGGYKPSTVIDFEIPKKYGLRQTVGDTLGIGGIMRSLRTIPVMLDMCADMEELCPDVQFLNYVNPMVMNCWAVNKATNIKTVGLCHSVPHTANDLARDIGIPSEEMNYVVAGINHMAFFLSLERNGVDLYPQVRQFMLEREKDGNWPVRHPDDMIDHVRYEMFKRLGYYVTESSEHFSEYTPWFIKRDRPDLLEQFDIPLDEYLRRCESQIADWESMRVELEGQGKPISHEQSVEYGSVVIHAMETGKPALIYGNVPNDNLITNLPNELPVEVPCVVDKNGIQPTVIGDIPHHLAAMMQTNINVQRLTVDAALTKKRETIYHAAMFDPHTAAELSLDQIWSMVDDLIEAHGDWLPQYE